MKRLIANYSAGAVATVNEDGTPAVSPKATFVVVNDECIAFGNIRSPGTVGNLRVRPDVEVTFLDVLARRAVRVRGRARVVEIDSEEGRRLTPLFQAQWAPYLKTMKQFVSIAISRAQLVTSPAYDLGLTEEELRNTNFEKLRRLTPP
jgi:predicted pyridoxine 5'-phosphate oxidase superfamily flavin-nucleotide-binding protein